MILLYGYLRRYTICVFEMSQTTKSTQHPRREGKFCRSQDVCCNICRAFGSRDQILDQGKILSKCHFEISIIPTTQSCGGRGINLYPCLDAANHRKNSRSCSHFQRTPALVPGASGILRTGISLAEAAHVLSHQGNVSYQHRLLGGFPRLWRHLCRLMSHYRGISCDNRKEPVTGGSLTPSPPPLASIEASSRTGRAT